MPRPTGRPKGRPLSQRTLDKRVALLDRSRDPSVNDKHHNPPVALLSTYQDFLSSKLDLRGSSERSHAVRFALAISPDIRFRDFLEHLDSHPALSLSNLAVMHNIAFPEFVKFWEDSMDNYARCIAKGSLPDLTRDHIRRAMPRDGDCAPCGGLGWIPVDQNLDPDDVPNAMRLKNGLLVRLCPSCEGKATGPAMADNTRVALLMEMNGYGKKPGVKIVQNFTGASLDQTMQKLNDVTFDVEAEAPDGDDAA